jgi:hypothetical protein
LFYFTKEDRKQKRFYFCDFRKHKYEILINTDHGAKLEWRSYNKFGGVPEGSVAGVDDTRSDFSEFAEPEFIFLFADITPTSLLCFDVWA